ncbi:MAG: TonB-dependent receptor [Methylomonas sp.]|nr:TonB-dependent receptor [Methylomonas sp.]PPD21812.1 MAG: TonB-dependent receptor [Methylomonas sp.]PPD27497.1 MAG: TonB-dependent receptor [Methylomonas sp.]PPD39480.1 MAG: TonB-dependent receptor [Methylomonas sp.]PPD42280.1 MAG: TonB-dependent receptor [Methylomonas sp.]
MQSYSSKPFFVAGALIALPIVPTFSHASSDKLPETVVTATRSDAARNELATATTVFTRDDIVKRQVRTLPELLKMAPGVDVVEQGGYGKATSIFMRGTNSDHILVLIDGIRAGSVTTGTTAFQFIPIDQIERVEIVRGPNSALYGTEAIGGVIQIFTRKAAQTDQPTLTFETGGGSYDTFTNAGSVSGRWGNSWYALGASHLNSQGINARQPTTGFFGVDHPDRDGFHNTGISARAGHRFDNDAEIEAFFTRSFGKTEFDGNPNKTDFVNQTVGTSLAFDVLDHWRSSLRFGQTEDLGDNFRPDGGFFSQFDTTRWTASWLNDIALGNDHRVTWGSDYRVDEVQSTTRYVETSRYDVGVFGQWHGRLLEQHFINAALRWDENQAFGDSVTGNIGWRFNWHHGLSAFASFGNAFKAPTFNQLYFPGFGNPDLQAETSNSVEAGVGGSHDWANWQVRAYQTRIDDLIVFTSQGGVFSAFNIGKAQINGIEGEISSEFLGWRHALNMNLIDPQDRISNRRLPRRAAQTLSYDVSRSFGDFDIGGHVLAQGSRYEHDFSGNTTEVDGFATVDLRTAWHIDKHWTLSGKLNNLLDKTYQTANTYNNFGRNFFFTIHYSN